MKSAGARTLLFLYLSLLIQLPVFGSKYGTLSPEAEREFKWFNALGFPDVRGKPLAYVNGGELFYTSNGGTTQCFVKCFLIETNQDILSALSLDLTPLTWAIARSANPATQSLKIVPLQFDQLIAEELKVAWLHSNEDFFRRPSQPIQFVDLPERTRLFVLGWAAWRNTNSIDADALYHLSKSFDYRGRRLMDRKPFHKILATDLATSELWRATLEFIDPAILRPALKTHLEAIAKNYPHTELAEDAKEMAKRLASMIREDEARQNRVHSSQPLTLHEQISDLIFQLRDQTVLQRGQPARCNIFQTIDGSTNSPAHQLLAIGYPAVPQLIATLDDKSLSRCVAFHRNFYFSHFVLSVGNCSLQILEKIAGQQFFVRTNATYIYTPDQITSARNAALSWWSHTQYEKLSPPSALDSSLNH